MIFYATTKCVNIYFLSLSNLNISLILIEALCLSQDGNLLVIKNSNKQLAVVDVRNSYVSKLFTHEDQISAISISPDNKYLFVGCSNDVLNIYNLETGVLEKSFGGGNNLAYYYLGYVNSITSIAISSDSNYAAIANNDSIKLYNVRTGKIQEQYTVSEFIKSMVFINENCLLVGNTDGVLKIINLFTGEVMMALKAHDSEIKQIAISHDGLKAVSLSSDGLSCLLDIKKGQLLSKFAFYNNKEWIFITPEGYFNTSSKGLNFLNIRVSPTEVTGINETQIKHYFKPDTVVQKLN